MRKDRKAAYQQRQIEKLTERVRSLEQENKVLEQENESLIKINKTNKKAIEDLQAEHKTAMDNYYAELAKIQKIKEQYKEAIKSARNIQSGYENKMRVLMQKLRQQTN